MKIKNKIYTSFVALFWGAMFVPLSSHAHDGKQDPSAALKTEKKTSFYDETNGGDPKMKVY